METVQRSLNQIIARFFIVAGIGIVLGYVLFRFSMFIPAMTYFQFTISSVTTGLFYAMLKSTTLRCGLVALLIWYFIDLAFFGPHNEWMAILNLAYIGGIAGACYLSLYIIKKRYVRIMILRIATFTISIAVVNGLIIIFLSLFYWRIATTHTNKLFQLILFNLELGTMIGLGLGIGIEISEVVINKYFPDKINSNESTTRTG